jgi:hypothetical protein
VPVDAPDPAAVRTTLTSSPVDAALAELDRICRRYDESLTLELAEDTYADLARGVDRLQTATCYVDRDLAALKRTLPGSVFSTLPAGHDAYELTRNDATLRLTFGRSHADRRPVETPYAAVEVAVPTTEAYLQRFYETVAARAEDGTHFNADG